MSEEKSGRRRGVELEDAILDAAWAELAERGYPDFTLERVAKRARTSRTVLQRRWPSRTALATAALSRHLAQHPFVVPDLGSLREEMRLLLRCLSDRARPDMIRLVFDMQQDLTDQPFIVATSRAQARAQLVAPDVMQTLLERATARGEIDAARLTPRMVSLATDLARHEILMTFRPLSEDAIHEIVDQIFWPLAASTARPR